MKPRKIFIRATNWIGDAVMTTPALGALRAACPEAELVIGANPLVAELFSSHPFCDRVLVYDKKGAHKGLWGMYRFAQILRRERFDMALLLQNAFEAALLARLAGIPLRAGYGTDGRALLLTHAIPVTESLRRLHHTDYYLKLLEALGIEGEAGGLHLSCTPEEERWAVQTLGAGEWVALNPGAAYGSAKRWFPDRFAAVADRLAEERGVRIVLTGGPGEAEIGAHIASAMRREPLNLIGKTSVRQMMALLAQCRLLITNDSGPMHVGAALGVPLVALFGPTDHTTTSPLSATSRIVRHPVPCAPCLKRQCPTDHRCMQGIGVEEVLAAAREVLGSLGKK